MYAWAPPEMHMRVSVIAVPIWIAVVGVLYVVTRKNKTGEP